VVLLWTNTARAQAPIGVATSSADGSTALTAAQLVSSGSEALRSGSFYSLQRPDYPPFPVNPHPDLPTYQIGDCDFVVDDRSVDYSREQPGAVLPSVPQPESGGTLSFGPGDLWLEITQASEAT